MTRLAGVGVGLVETPRFARAIERHGERLLVRVFTEAELAYGRRKRDGAHNWAARFVAKCAGRRVLRRLDPRPLPLLQLEVVRRPSGEPTLVARGPARERFPADRYRLSLSLTHDADFAAASVWLEVGAGA